ncbi:unnamed protein product [Symbiodinium microadriaticum]|nr:unnamed protein product [Symbiodinium sp. KB8]CAE7847900.1 unnamed protein product [Symbiodinium microadriaticum]
MTSATAASGIVRNKDGVPSWDGNGSTYQEYEEVCLLWQESTEYHKRYLNGPKLAGELTGPAKRLILGKPAVWLSHPDGVQTLLEYLRSCLGRPQAGESMSDYVTRTARQLGLHGDTDQYYDRQRTMMMVTSKWMEIKAEDEAYDRSYWMEHGMNEEGLAAMDAAEEDIQEAMAAMQKFVKLSRKHYQNSGAARSQRGSAPDDSKMTCLKCGRIGHRAAHCPEKKDTTEPQHAPFVCFGDVDIAWASGSSMTTDEAISEAMAVIDGDGEMLLEAAGKPGHLQIHTLEEGKGPILLSVDTLRALDDRKLIPVTRSAPNEPCQVSSHIEELRPRCISELQEAQGIDPFAKTKTRTPLREQVTQLNRHKKTKAMLTEYVGTELDLMLNGNETMEQIE